MLLASSSSSSSRFSASTTMRKAIRFVAQAGRQKHHRLSTASSTFYTNYYHQHHIHHYYSSPPPLLAATPPLRVEALQPAPPQARCFSSSSYVQQQTATTSSRIRIPPNLKIDANSSFAPQKAAAKKALRIPISNEKQEEDDDQEEKEERLEQEDDDVHGELDEEDEDEEEDFYLPPPDVEYAISLPERLHVPIYTLFAPQYDNEVGTIWLDDAVFGRDPIRVDLLKQAVVYFRNKKRGRRKAVTKTISQVRGSGRKLRPQKGQGMARVGHSRPAHYRGGAKAHGPKNTTDYGKTKLNKKVRRLALSHALSQKLLEGNLIVLNQLHDLPTHKTQDLARLLKPWQIGGRSSSSRGSTTSSALIIDSYFKNDQNNKDEQVVDSDSEEPTSYSGVPTNLWVAATNLPKVKVGSDHQATVYDILKHEKLVMTLSAVQVLEERLKNI